MEPEITAPPQAPNAEPLPPAEVAPQDGYQKRIDELTQQLREQERRTQDAYKAVADVTASSITQRPPQHQEPEDPLAAYRDKVDPTALEVMSKMQAQLERKFQQQYAQLEASFGVRQIETAGASIPGVPPEVVQRAQELYQGNRKSGGSASHDEALNFAIGEYIRKGGQLKPAQAQAPQYGSPNAVLPGFAPAPRPAAALPTNFDSLPRQQQTAILRARYENEPF